MKDNYYFHQKPVITWNMVGICFKAEKHDAGAILSMRYDADKAINVVLPGQLFKVDEFIDWFKDNDNYVELRLQGVIEDNLPLITNLKIDNATQKTRYYA